MAGCCVQCCCAACCCAACCAACCCWRACCCVAADDVLRGHRQMKILHPSSFFASTCIRLSHQSSSETPPPSSAAVPLLLGQLSPPPFASGPLRRLKPRLHLRCPRGPSVLLVRRFFHAHASCCRQPARREQLIRGLLQPQFLILMIVTLAAVGLLLSNLVLGIGRPLLLVGLLAKPRFGVGGACSASFMFLSSNAAASSACISSATCFNRSVVISSRRRAVCCCCRRLAPATKSWCKQLLASSRFLPATRPVGGLRGEL